MHRKEYALPHMLTYGLCLAVCPVIAQKFEKLFPAKVGDPSRLCEHVL